jgi:hypothetical protein
MWRLRRTARRETDAHRILLIVDDRCAPWAIRKAIAARVEGCASEVLVVAPAGAGATRHLEATLDELALVRDIDVRRGHIGSHDPIEAADEALRAFPADQIVFTVAAGTERPKARAVDIAPSRYDIPVTVTQVTATSADATAPSVSS